MGRRFLPDFFILGAQKSGTSTLHHILKSTDIVSLPKNKETHYFSHFINKNRNYSWYKKQFFIKDSHELIGEVDPSYIYIADTAKNIEKIIKNPKIIIILRKPIDRAFSHYSMSCRRGFEEHSFIKAILNEDKRLEKREEFNLNNFSYLDRGNYFFQIMKYKKIFKKSSFLFLKFDDLLDKKSKEKLIISLFEFLGIKKQYKKFDFDTIHINKNKVFRFKWIQNILYRNSKLKILLSKMITDPNLRYRIKNFIEKINLTDSDDYKSTIIDNYKELPEKIINWNNHEVSQLEKITNLNLKNWHI